MDERARVPVTLPRDHPTKPFWQDPPDAEISDVQSTPALPTTADIVLVGSGITGASIAWHLLTDSASSASSAGTASPPSIVMLEARQACSGATGRNGGHTKAASYRSFADHAAALGTPAAVQIARLELDGIRTVHALAVSEAIACDANPCETADVIYDPEQWTRAQETIAAMRAAMPPDDPAAAYRLYSRAEALEAAAAGDLPCSDDAGDATSGPPAPLCGVVCYEAGSLSAYRFVAGVLKRCLARGLNLQTHTPATALQRDAGTGLWTVETPRGAIRARHVVLATNGYSAFLEPRLQGVVVPLRGQITMHEPGRVGDNGRDPSRQLARTYSFIYPRGYEYMISRPVGATRAGAMVIGGGLTYADGQGGIGEFGTVDDTALNPAVSAYLQATPRRYFGRTSCWGAADAHVAAEWTGIMGYTADGYPLVGAMAGAEADSKNLWLCCAFQGHGMVYSWLSGRAAAAMVQGHDDDGLRRWFPDCFRVTAARLQQQFAGKQGSKL